jgi:hypothetical protein
VQRLRHSTWQAPENVANLTCTRLTWRSEAAVTVHSSAAWSLLIEPLVTDVASFRVCAVLVRTAWVSEVNSGFRGNQQHQLPPHFTCFCSRRIECM